MSAKLLVIEDDSFLRELIVKKLINEGFEVSEGVDGEEGLKKAQEGGMNMILLDLILPGIDGFEVLKRVKEDPKINSVPVIILSNLGQKEDIERGLKLGATDFLIKAHFTPAEIIEKIKSVLKK
ncbi:MAG TPA: response regulator [Candidatus Pacearchaeota archaeon]|nr:response regulator [Candidatus Pacearchaeota archaeon]